MGGKPEPVASWRANKSTTNN